MLIEEIVYQMLDEVAMNPNALRRAVAQINARAGMEFELIVPDFGSVEETGEFSDDNDDRSETFDNVFNFFAYSGRQENSESDVRDMVSAMEEKYRDEFVYDALMDAWSEVQDREIINYIEDNIDMSELISNFAEQIEEVFQEFEVDFPESYEDEDLERLIDENGLEAEIHKAVAQKSRDDYDDMYDLVRSEWEEQNYEEIFYNEGNQRTWMSNSGNAWLSDIVQNFGYDHGVMWPTGGSGDAEERLQDLADSFGEAVGKHTNYSMSYHGGERNDGEYTIEPDSSLNGDGYDDAGLEFISPPMPLDEMFADIDAIVAWASENGVYTNSSTGLHMNIDVPTYNRENLDFIKLVLLMGDQYVLEQFGRRFNNYAASALDQVEKAIERKDYNLEEIFDKMKAQMEKDASKSIHSGDTQKFTSVNVKRGWVEFRSPGGDWLNGDIDKVKNTLMRFVVALDAACDPEKYKNEYLKKLYKLVAGIANKNQVDITKAFADYSAGVLNKNELKQLISQRIMNTRARKEKQAGADATAAMQDIADTIGSLYNQLNAYDYGSGDTLSTDFETNLRKVADAFQSNGAVKKRLEELLDRIEVKDSVQSWDASKVLLAWLRDKYSKV